MPDTQTTATAATPAEALRMAADQIARDGRAIGEYHDEQGRACVVAAIQDAAPGDVPGSVSPIAGVAFDALERRVGRIGAWSDDPDLPDCDVAAILRETADGLDGLS